MRQSLLWGLILIGCTASAKTKVDISPFVNQVAPGPCNFVEAWKKSIEQNFQLQLSNALNQSGHFTIVEAERMRGEERAKLFDSGVSTMHKNGTFKASQFSIVGALKSFNVCNRKAEVVLEIQVIENSDGSVKHRFTVAGAAKGDADDQVKGAAFSSGLFKDSPIGRATVSAIADATGILKRHFPEREIASQEDYKIRTIPRSRAH